MRRSIHTKPELSGEAQCCGGFIPGGIGCWKEKTPGIITAAIVGWWRNRK
ncbi:type I toxin-antitoxin system toxin Ldr family protein [Escherichia coli]|nr:type I toxin-antitoxin system toxin Ldr family protein [Escherichia coli]